MQQTLEQLRAAGQGSAKNEASVEPDVERLRSENYSVDEDVKTVFDRFRQAIAARHELAVLRARKLLGET